MALGHSPQIVTQGLVYYIDPSNTRSYAGYGNTIYNMVNSSIGGTFVGYTSNPIDNTFTRSIVFDGNDYINIPSGNLIYGTAPRTMITWSKISANDGSTHASFAYGNPASNQAFFIGVSGLNPFCGAWGNDLTAGNTTIALNTWFHTACVFDGTTAYLYVAGILTTSATKAWNTSNVNRAYLGRQVDNGQYWNGNIGQALIYNRALSATEILQNYNTTRKKYYPEERIVTDGLILNYDFSKRNSYSGTGSVVTDLSTTGNNGSLVNSPTFTSLNGGGMVFNGTNQTLNVSSNPSSTNQITVSVWIKLANNNGIGWIIGREAAYRILYENGNIYWVCATTNNSWYTTGTNLSASDISVFDSWWHIIATYDGLNNRLYINGQLKATGANISGNIANGQNLSIMFPTASGLVYGKGTIGEIKIYNRALTQQEILQNYNATKNRFVNALPPVRNNLILELDATSVSSYPGTGTSWYDTSGFSNNANFINGPTFSATGTSSSIAFDGTNDYVDMNYPSQINTGSPITLALWAKWITTGTTTATIQTLVDNNYQTAYIDGPGSIGFFIQDRPDLGGVLEWGAKPGIGITRCTSTFVVGDGKWHYITATNDGATSRLYVDGIQSGLARTAAGIGDSQPFINLGRWRFTQTRYLNGNIADFRMYNRALSDYEVKQNFDYYRTRYGI